MNKEDLLCLYEKMVLIRSFEETVFDVFVSGVIAGTVHICSGQEAVAVGACSALERDDYVVSNHRGHGHFIAKGGDPKRIMAELFGKSTGYCGGRGGSQHIACVEIGFLGSNGITGGGIPVATGAGFALRQKRSDRVVLCFFGDGASNQGTFHESLNMSAIWQLPVIYLCENNLYAMSTRFDEAFRISDIAKRAESYGMPGEICDGQDVLAVRKTVERAVNRARNGGGPTLIECKTYRFRGHSKSDTCEYRDPREEERWRRRDPIALFSEKLKRDGIASEDELRWVAEEAEKVVEEAIEFAKSSPDPSPEEMTGDLYA